MQWSQIKKNVNCIWISSIKHFVPSLYNKDKVIKKQTKKYPPVVRSDPSK